jgi:hypothetical protein
MDRARRRLPGLSETFILYSNAEILFSWRAEGVGFEPTRSVNPFRFSRPVPSATRRALQYISFHSKPLPKYSTLMVWSTAGLSSKHSMKVMDIIKIVAALFTLYILQLIAMKPLKKIGTSNEILFMTAPGLIIITCSLAYYINGIFNFGFNSIEVSFCAAFILTYLFFKFLTKSKLPKKNKDNIKKSKVILVHVIILGFSISLLNITPISNLILTGDTFDFVNLSQTINDQRQRLFGLSYIDPGDSKLYSGIFYPWAGLIIGVIVEKLTNTDFTFSTIYTLILFSVVVYILSIFALMKLLGVNSRFLLIIPLLIMNIFPVGLISSGNYSLIYGILGAITLINLNLILRQHLHRLMQLAIMIFSLILLIPIHPSTIFTFLIIAWSIKCIYLNNADRIKLTFKKRKDLHKITIILTAFSIISLLILNSLDSVSIEFFANVNSFSRSLPNNANMTEFLNLQVYSRIFAFYWENVFTLAFWDFKIPWTIFTIIMAIYVKVRSRYSFFYFYPMFAYFLLISVSSVSGINHPIRIISIMTWPYYSSPLRVTHIGVLISLLYIGKFLLIQQDKKSLSV